jgi:hypothetical protein
MRSLLPQLRIVRCFLCSLVGLVSSEHTEELIFIEVYILTNHPVRR